MNTYDPNFISKKSFAIVGQKAIIINAENRILVLKRSVRSGLGNKWSLPGGALEQGEEPFEAIRREIDEETQLVVKDIMPFYVKSYLNNDGDFVVIIGYSCVKEMGKVKLNWEHDDFGWFTKKETLELDLTKDGKTFIEHFDMQKND